MTRFITTIALAAGIAVFMTGCKKTQPVSKIKGQTKVVQFCTGDEYESNGKYFRSSATGNSQNMEIAKSKARTAASAKLAQSVSQTVRSVTERHVSSTEYNNREEATGAFDELQRIVVDQELKGAITICDELTIDESGMYYAYVSLELSGEKIATAYSEKISSDERIMAEFNRERFKETFNEDMNRRRN